MYTTAKDVRRTPPKGAAADEPREKEKPPMRILLVEDDEKIASFILGGLRQSGFAVDHAANGLDGLHLATTEPYAVAIIDVMLPGMDGLKVIEEVRRRKINTPIIILSAKRSVEDRVRGARDRQRRLPVQAVLLFRTAGPGAGADPPVHPARPSPPA